MNDATTVAAVDLGSNSFHMIVGRMNNGELVIIDKLREMVRLAGGLDADRNLDEAAMERAIACLERFGQRLNTLPRTHVRAVGTNTLRSARNAREFMARARAALGHPIEIIAGVEEARLIYLGVSRSLAAEGNQLVIDIGGGSTEFIIGRGREPISLESLHMGCVTMSSRWFPDDSLSKEAWKQAENAALARIGPIRTAYRRQGWERAIGASGTMRSVAKVLAAEGLNDEGLITPDGVKQLRKRLLKAGSVAAAGFKGLKEEREPVFAGGLAVVSAAIKGLGIERLEVSDGALREGLLEDLLGRMAHSDVRGRSIESLARRYHVEQDHASRVAAMAGELRRQADEAGWPVGDGDSPWYLEWAARIHEIGLDIAHSSHHKHGAYIIANADLGGFSRQEQALIAALVQNHQRKLRPDSFAALDETQQQPGLHQAILLRLAVLLHRNRDPEPPPAPLATFPAADHLVLRFPDDWLDEHPLTVTDLEQEKAYLDNAGYTLEFA